MTTLPKILHSAPLPPIFTQSSIILAGSMALGVQEGLAVAILSNERASKTLQSMLERWDEYNPEEQQALSATIAAHNKCVQLLDQALRASGEAVAEAQKGREISRAKREGAHTRESIH